ncbi:class I SAM-dependent methyltransferase [Nocardia arthritidis]|uniref:S-adenosyl-L-methionine-dependent methyltransferase n=1 Tax=Nocardia arthritidis TaxID=228602 RepID=A0A6G9YDF5_9NOCA|nr:class I SAM-dependent methyltransferase [Nocardia arthritidis]QIS11232.1 SAM-dependent methyltransferase [Nocardia arthritidis]
MRTDDDSWDITTSVGATALGVAAMRAAESSRPDALFHDPYAAELVAATGAPAWQRIGAAVRSRVDAATAESYRPIGSFMVARTLYFDEYFTAASAAGIRQVVILAAGLDARAYRLDWPTGTTVFELDQPKVLEFKAAALAAHRPRADRREVAVDLRQDWPKALRDKGFDPGRPTAWLAEGLLRYLPADAQDRLFENIVALSAPGSRVAVNIAHDRPRPTEDQRQRRARLKEQLGIEVDFDTLWYPSDGRSDPREWFAGHGWTISSGDPVTLLTERGREVPDTARAELGHHNLITAELPA